MKRYRFTAIALAFALLIPSLAACGLKKGEIAIAETSAEENVSAKPNDILTTKAEPTTAVSTTAVSTTAAPTTAAPTTEAPTQKPTEAPTQKPTEAPTEKSTEKPTEAPTEAPTEPPKKTPSAAQVASAIAANGSCFDEALVESSASRGLSLFGIDAGSVAEASYYAASAAVADEILVVKLAAGASAEEIRSGFADRQSIQAEDYEDYVPSEVPKINNAVIYQNGDMLVFCVSNDSAAVRSTLDSLF